MIEELLSHGHEFSFSQVMRVARMHLGAGGAQELPEVPWQDRIQVRPDLSLTFPASDVARVERAGADGADLLVTTTFLGLYGSSSPLPTHYTEELLDESAADSTVSREFLDLLHQRLYQLYFQCWSKYRLFIRVAEEKNPEDLERLYCLIGLGEKELRDSIPDAGSLLRYAGLFSHSPRSADGLKTLLRDALGVSKLEVEQCVLRTVPIPEDQQMRLGLSNISLGVNTVLGSEVPDRMGKFRIHIGPLSKDEFDTFLPGTTRHNKLARLIRLYIVDPFEFDLKLILASGEAQPIRLGDTNGPPLGLNSWSFSGDTLGEVSAIIPISQSAAKAPAAADDLSSVPQPKRVSTLISNYQQELARLRDLAASYAEAHPEVASMVNGNVADPSVERLFEGVAFLNANLQQKLNDDFPEIIHDLIHAIQPNHMQPIPAATIIVFSPKPNCTAPQMIPTGTQLRSVPVHGTACDFTTCHPVGIHPLTLVEACLSQPSGKPCAITLSFKLIGISLEKWNIKSLRLFLAHDVSPAANLYLVLMRYLKRIVIAPVKGGQSVTLDATHLRPASLENREVLFPATAFGAVSYHTMQEYLTQPTRLLFVDLLGWEQWRGRGEGGEFQVRFELKALPFVLHQVSKADFALFATPAVNLFKHWAEPIAVDGKESEYQIRPAEGHVLHYEIVSVDRVTGLLSNTNQKVPFISSLEANSELRTVPTYHLEWRQAATRNGLDTFLTFQIPDNNASNEITTIILDLVCTNGNLPQKLKIGDVREETDNSPSFAEFTNSKPITCCQWVDAGNNALWRMYSRNNVNIRILSVESLRAMLAPALQSRNDDTTVRAFANLSLGITDLQVTSTARLVGAYMQQGWEIRIKLDHATDVSPGEVFLFGELLDHFLRGFASELCLTKTIVESIRDGEKYDWPAKMGRRALM